MGTLLSKNKLLLELATATSVPRKDVANILNALATIAYREAVNGFTVPGICRLKVAQKKACRRRNPKTGQILMIGEHRVLRIVPLKKAKDMVAPRPADLVRKVAATTPPPSAEKTDAAKPATAIAPALSSELPEEGAGEIVFRCSHCRSVLAAPPAQAGTECTCPYCKAKIAIPGCEPPPKASTPARTDATREQRPAEKRTEDFITFVCQTCDQAIEAPIDMLGMEVNCPACGAAIHIPTSEETKASASSGLYKQPAGIDRSAMTIRIDLSKLE